MAQTNYTPISLYYSTTASAAPTSGNLVNGELAINITDGKLYFKNNSGTVTLLASAAGASGDVVGPSSATDNALVRFDTTTGKLVQNSVGILSDAGALTGLTGITTTGTTSTSVLSVTGNTTLGDASSDTLVVNALVNANLLFTDNTYDIGASGATRPRAGYFGTSANAPLLVASPNASSNTAPVAGGLLLASGGLTSGYFSPAIEFDIAGGGGKARMYTTRLNASGGRFYLDTMATDGVYYNRQLVTETGEFYWYNNNVTTGAQAMSLTGSNLVVNGQIQSNLEDGLISTSQNVANNGIYLQVRPYSGQSGYLTFTENAIADRWSIGILPGDGTLYFRAGQVTGTSVMQVSSGGKLSLATATIYGNSNLTVPWVNTSSSSIALYNIGALTVDAFRGAFGDVVFKSSSSFANNAAQAMMYLAARNYGSSQATANDVTQGVGLWIRGYYDNNGAAVPIYIGGYSYNSTVPGIIVNQSTNVGVGATGADPVYRFDVNASVVSNYVARILNNSGSTSSDHCLLLQTNTASDARLVSAQNSGTEVFSVTGAGITTIGTARGNIANSLNLGVQGGITVANGLYTAGTWTTNSAGSIILTANSYPANTGLLANIVFRAGSSGGGGPSQVASIYGETGVICANSSTNLGSFKGKVVAGDSGSASISALTYPGASTLDTGISINQGSAGGTMLFLCSVNTSAGTSTTSAVYMIQFYYDGNNTPAVTLISGSNSWTFGKSGSNTLTVVGPAGNASYAWFGNK